MSASGFAIFCLVGFLLPVPILAWLDRPRGSRSAGDAGRGAPRREPLAEPAARE